MNDRFSKEGETEQSGSTARTPSGPESPTASASIGDINIGGARQTVNFPMPQATPPPTPDPPVARSAGERWRTLGKIFLGIVAVIGTIAGLGQWLGWNLFG